MKHDEGEEKIRSAAAESLELRKKVATDLARPLLELAKIMADRIRGGGKVLLCGNGGSAADSSHMAAEMIVRLTSERNRRSLPALALTADQAVLTAAANDFGFEQIFARQVEGLGREGDVLTLISTSGHSANLIFAAETAKKMGLMTAALLGKDGGRLRSLVDHAIIIPHDSVQRIQEEQIFLIHLLVELIESELF